MNCPTFFNPNPNLNPNRIRFLRCEINGQETNAIKIKIGIRIRKGWGGRP
jgi:hypothetical protein